MFDWTKINQERQHVTASTLFGIIQTEAAKHVKTTSVDITSSQAREMGNIVISKVFLDSLKFENISEKLRTIGSKGHDGIIFLIVVLKT